MNTDYMNELMRQALTKIFERKQIEAETAISEYMTKHNLFIHDMEKYGEEVYMLDTQKIVYKYKSDIICEISFKMEIDISDKKLTISSEEIPEPHTMLNYPKESEQPPSCHTCGTMLKAHCDSCHNFSWWIPRNY